MLTISKLSDYAIVIMSQLAICEQETYSASKLAELTGVALPTVSKLLKNLAHAGLLISLRGTKGGYSLALPGHEISLAHIIEAVDGPIGLTACSKQTGDCDLLDQCNMSESWNLVSQGIRQALATISLSDMISKTIDKTAIHETMQNCFTCAQQEACHG